jgi:nicotinamidase-related amidase
MTRRIVADRSLGAIIDVQEFFLAQTPESVRSKIETNLVHLLRLLGHFRIPLIVTIERPIEQKGAVPQWLESHLGGLSKTFEKNFFDLTREQSIRNHLARLKNRNQVIVAGGETDVCVLQSCLGLIDLGHEVYPVEELLFSSSANVDAAVARMRIQGAVFTSYKSVYYELVEAVDTGEHATDMASRLGPLPLDIPDCIA